VAGVPAATLDAAFLDFLIELDTTVLADDPDDLDALARLGESYTRRGRYAEGLAIDRRLVALQPEDETAHYNLACSLALTGDRDGAFAALDAAVAHGYDAVHHLLADEDLAALHDDPRWDALVQRLRAK
jgi:Flp pilus assembly protein TadD